MRFYLCVAALLALASCEDVPFPQWNTGKIEGWNKLSPSEQEDTKNYFDAFKLLYQRQDEEGFDLLADETPEYIIDRLEMLENRRRSLVNKADEIFEWNTDYVGWYRLSEDEQSQVREAYDTLNSKVNHWDEFDSYLDNLPDNIWDVLNKMSEGVPQY